MKTEDQEGEAGKGETVKGQRERTKQATGSGQRVKARESSGSAGQGDSGVKTPTTSLKLPRKQWA